MSTSFYANAIIGVEVDPYKVLPDRKVRACDCKKKVSEDMKFCPSCGHKAWKKAEEAIEGFEYDDDTYTYTLFGLPVLCLSGYEPTDMDYHRTLQMFVVAEKACHGDVCYGNNMPKMTVLPENLSEMKEKLKKTLEPHGLWDESKFGLWAVGELS